MIFLIENPIGCLLLGGALKGDQKLQSKYVSQVLYWQQGEAKLVDNQQGQILWGIFWYWNDICTLPTLWEASVSQHNE